MAYRTATPALRGAKDLKHLTSKVVMVKIVKLKTVMTKWNNGGGCAVADGT
jgi:hypothetical protein